jgi:hypothetical protein
MLDVDRDKERSEHYYVDQSGIRHRTTVRE